ncbi:MAG: AAA family ATPase, partial [Candidatus Anammoxibacter sp.]
MQRRKRGRKCLNLTSGYMFNSTFEEKKIVGYLVNLINSRFLRNKTKELFEFSYKVLGEETITSCLKESFPKIVANEEFPGWIEDDVLARHVPRKVLIKLLKNTVAPVLMKRLKNISSNNTSGSGKRLQHLKEAFNMTNDELAIITFYCIVQTCSLVEDYLGRNGEICDFESLSTLKAHGKILLGLEQYCLKDTLSNGVVFKAGIIDISSPSSIDLKDWCLDYLIGVGKDDLAHEFFTKENSETLQVPDFDVPGNEIDILKTLMKTKGRQNILLYGEPGTGKTSFTRSFARAYGKELYTVKNSKTDDHEDRLKAIYATVNLADKDNSVVLVDEADEILNSYKSFFFESKTTKSWINTFLEDHDKKVIWITNRVTEIDSSTMRRFGFSIEFKKFSHKNRLKVLNHSLRKQKLHGYFSDDELNELCRTYKVNAGGIIDAINLLKISKKTKKENALKKIKTVLKNHEKVTIGRKGGNTKVKEFKHYSLEGMNTSQDLNKIISVIKQYIKRKEVEANINNNCSITSLLYGLPGTGKSEFVYYLG